MTGSNDDWMLVGQIVGAHGIHGELKVRPLTDFPDRFALLKHVYLGDKHAEHEVISARGQKHVLLRLGSVDTRTMAHQLTGTEVWIPRSEAMELPQGQYYVDDMIGLRVETESGQVIGVVKELIITGANDVYVVKQGNRELLLPAIHDVVREIDPMAGKIIIHPMEGLLD